MNTSPGFSVTSSGAAQRPFSKARRQTRSALSRYACQATQVLPHIPAHFDVIVAHSRVLPPYLPEMRALNPNVRVFAYQKGIFTYDGTLSEVAFALRTGVPVVGLRTWDLDDVIDAPGAVEAVDLALALAAERADP